MDSFSPKVAARPAKASSPSRPAQQLQAEPQTAVSGVAYEPVRFKARSHHAPPPIPRSLDVPLPVREHRKVETHPLATPPHPKRREIERKLKERETETRFRRERQEMQEVHDLRQVEDDVEAAATLYEWHAEEHTHRPKTARWFMALAASIALTGAGLVFMGNFLGAVTVAFAGGLVYYIAQQKPPFVRYRIMVDGVAMNNVLYHYRDLLAFNVVYQPGEVKTVILRSERRFAPLLHMEIGEADPLVIRDILLEFMREDLDMDEPLIDVLARRAGF